MKVPYLLEPAIERDAEVLLAQFCGARGVELSAPIPVEEILEQHLGLSLGFDDLHARFEVPQMGEEPDVLGALFVDRREVLINQVLDPEDHPFQEGRYRYTLGHEIGHWELHRELVSAAAGAPTLFGRAAAAPIICRRSQAREPIEWQADTYSAHLLMPRTLIVKTWRNRFGNLRPQIICHEDEVRDFTRPFTKQFGVSSKAVDIRLGALGLLCREAPAQLSFITTS